MRVHTNKGLIGQVFAMYSVFKVVLDLPLVHPAIWIVRAIWIRPAKWIVWVVHVVYVIPTTWIVRAIWIHRRVGPSRVALSIVKGGAPAPSTKYQADD